MNKVTTDFLMAYLNPYPRISYHYPLLLSISKWVHLIRSIFNRKHVFRPFLCVNTSMSTTHIWPEADKWASNQSKKKYTKQGQRQARSQSEKNNKIFPIFTASQKLAGSLSNVLMNFIDNSSICEVRIVLKMGLKR